MSSSKAELLVFVEGLRVSDRLLVTTTLMTSSQAEPTPWALPAVFPSLVCGKHVYQLAACKTQQLCRTQQPEPLNSVGHQGQMKPCPFDSSTLFRILCSGSVSSRFSSGIRQRLPVWISCFQPYCLPNTARAFFLKHNSRVQLLCPVALDGPTLP